MSTPNTTRITCPQCGMQISPPPTLTKVVCPRCGAHIPTAGSRAAVYSPQPAVPNPEPTGYAQAIAPVAPAAPVGFAPTDAQVLAELRELRLENQMMRLDQAWDHERKRYYVRDRHRGLLEPTRRLLVTRLLLVALVLLVATVVYLYALFTGSQASASAACLPLLAISLAFLLPLSITIIEAYVQHRRYVAAFDDYLSRRKDLLDQYRGQPHN